MHSSEGSFAARAAPAPRERDSAFRKIESGDSRLSRNIRGDLWLDLQAELRPREVDAKIQKILIFFKKIKIPFFFDFKILCFLSYNLSQANLTCQVPCAVGRGPPLLQWLLRVVLR